MANEKPGPKPNQAEPNHRQMSRARGKHFVIISFCKWRASNETKEIKFNIQRNFWNRNEMPWDENGNGNGNGNGIGNGNW